MIIKENFIKSKSLKKPTKDTQVFHPTVEMTGLYIHLKNSTVKINTRLSPFGPKIDRKNIPIDLLYLYIKNR
jgi:hypothetical protein